MNATTYRQSCGTHQGLILHSAAGEFPCGECRLGELTRRAEVEAWPAGFGRLAAAPISKQQAAQNLALLMVAMADDPASVLAPPDLRGDPNG